jgi:hypothetical protein
VSAAFKATADELTALSSFLESINGATEATGVQIVDRFTVEVSHGGSQIDVAYDGAIEAYVIDDRVGN